MKRVPFVLLLALHLTGNRRKIGVDDPRLEDRVADNLCKFDLTESETLLIEETLAPSPIQ